MATPFSIQKLIFLCTDDFEEVKKNIVHYKLNFCLSFEKEMGGAVSQYAENLFDYVYNLFYVKPAFKEEEHRQYVDNFMSLNFTDVLGSNAFIDASYRQILIKNRDHIFKLLKIETDDVQKISYQFKKNIKQNYEIMKKGFF